MNRQRATACNRPESQRTINTIKNSQAISYFTVVQVTAVTARTTKSVTVTHLSNSYSTISGRTAGTDNLSIYVSLFVSYNKPYSTAKRKKQWKGTDKANSSYSRPKKRKNENESSYNNCDDMKCHLSNRWKYLDNSTVILYYFSYICCPISALQSHTDHWLWKKWHILVK